MSSPSFDKPTGDVLSSGTADKAQPALTQAVASYASAATSRPEAVRFNWADIPIEADLPEEAKKASQVGSLVAEIRRRGASRDDCRIIIPGNLFTAAPLLAWRMHKASLLSGSALVKEEGIKISSIFAPALSLDETERVSFQSGFKPVPGSAEYEGLLCLLKLSDFLETIVPSEVIEKGGERDTALFLQHLLAGIYCEETYQIPLAQSARWWSCPGAEREKVIQRLSGVLGSHKAAQLLITSYDILYRKMVRRLLAKEGEHAEAVARFRKIAQAYIERITVSSGGMFFRCYRPTTVDVTETVRDPTKKDPNRTKTVKTTKKVVIRPHFPKGPSSPWEAATVGRINEALGRIEANPERFSFEKHGSPHQWAGRIARCVSQVYAKAAPYSKIVASRRREVRSLIFEAHGLQVGAANVAPPPQTPTPVITTAGWERVATSLAKERAAIWEGELIEQARLLLGVPDLSRDRLQRMEIQEMTACILQSTMSPL